MNIDERLEALTQGVELLASLHRDTEAQITRLSQKIDKLSDTVDKLSDIVAPIAQLVLDHEKRLKALES